MRVSHLTDHEIQEYLDRSNAYRGQPDEVAEHIQNCSRCREELNLYRQLVGELVEAPEVVKLPRNFAKKVTLSLPPLAAARTRTRVQAALTGVAMVLTTILVLAVMNLKLVMSAASVSLTTGYVTAVTWLESVLSLVPSLDLSSLQSMADLFTFQVVKQYLIAMNEPVNLFLVAAVTIILITSLEGLLPMRPHRQRTR